MFRFGGDTYDVFHTLINGYLLNTQFQPIVPMEKLNWFQDPVLLILKW